MANLLHKSLALSSGKEVNMCLSKLAVMGVSLLSLSFPLFGKEFLVRDSTRFLEIIDVVDGSMISGVAAKIDNLSQQSDAPIDILINSPGGNVLIGTSIIDAMSVAKSRGVHFRCISGVMAASMAFVILAHCTERYVLPNTKLLFHPVSIGGGGGRLQEMLIALEQIKITEMEVMRFINSKMKLPWEKFHMHYFAETMWSGWSLAKHTGGDCKFLCVVTDVRGVKSLFTTQREKPLFLFKAFKDDYLQVNKVLEKAGLPLIEFPEIDNNTK